MKLLLVAVILLVGFTGCADKTPYDFTQWHGSCREYDETSARYQECIREVNQAIQEDVKSHSVSTYESKFFDSKSYYETLEEDKRYREKHDNLVFPESDRPSRAICRTTDRPLTKSDTECVTNY